MIVDEVGADILRWYKHDEGAKFDDMVLKIDDLTSLISEAGACVTEGGVNRGEPRLADLDKGELHVSDDVGVL